MRFCKIAITNSSQSFVFEDKRGERLYWEEINIDPKVYADELWEEYNETKKL